MTVLIIAEQEHGKLSPGTLSTINAAQVFSLPIEILLMGKDCKALALEASAYDSIEKVWTIEDPSLEHPIAELMTASLMEKAKDYKYILAPSTTFGKNLLPRLAALLDVALISDVVEIKDKKTFVRPIYAGNALATITSDDPHKVLTIRPTAFEKVEKSSSKAGVEKWPFKAPISPHPTFVKREENVSERPELMAASIVVAGGRGFQRKENFDLLEKLADALGAAIGASRAAVDAGFVPNDYQVGQTGKIVAPTLYIAIGISGAIQHLAGMKDSKVIVAINKDPDAPIFQIADYGLVGDLFTILPEFIEKVKAIRKGS